MVMIESPTTTSSALFVQQSLILNTTALEAETIQPPLVREHDDVQNNHGTISAEIVTDRKYPCRINFTFELPTSIACGINSVTRFNFDPLQFLFSYS